MQLLVGERALELVEVGGLGQSGPLVAVDLGDAVRVLDLLLAAHDQVTVLDAHVNVLRVDALGHLEVELDHALARVRLSDARQQVLVHVHARLLERHLDDQLALRGHEAHQLLLLGVVR